MQELVVSQKESGQRLDKYLRRYLPKASSSFIYKMLRKKNITLQGKKADGSEKVKTGDSVKLFLSEETIRKFSRPQDDADARKAVEEAQRAFRKLQPLLGPSPVLYEDEDVLVVRKPSGVLSQKAESSDLSMNEWLRGYLADFAAAAPSVYRPSVCNRLDRNTGGILLCAKTLPGSRALSLVIRDRVIRKTYTMVVHGQILESGVIDKDLIKDRQLNRVRVAGETPDNTGHSGKDAVVRAEGKDLSAGNMRTDRKINNGRTDRTVSADRTGREEKRHAVTAFRPVRTGKYATMVEADLITGRSHQLRVHMASIGHPIIGDPAYGDRTKDSALMRRLQDRREGSSMIYVRDPGTGSGSAGSEKRSNVRDKANRHRSEQNELNGRGDWNRFPRRQLLWCVEVALPDRQELQEMADIQGDPGIRDVLMKLAGRVFHCPPPKWWEELCEI